MPTWLKWVLAGLVLLVLAAFYPHRAQLDTIGVMIGLGTLAWLLVGALLAFRQVLRFLRR